MNLPGGLQRLAAAEFLLRGRFIAGRWRALSGFLAGEWIQTPKIERARHGHRREDRGEGEDCDDR